MSRKSVKIRQFNYWRNKTNPQKWRELLFRIIAEANLTQEEAGYRILLRISESNQSELSKLKNGRWPSIYLMRSYDNLEELAKRWANELDSRLKFEQKERDRKKFEKLRQYRLTVPQKTQSSSSIAYAGNT